jgi:hypothetical protein
MSFTTTKNREREREKENKKKEKTACPREDSVEIHEYSLSVNN